MDNEKETSSATKHNAEDSEKMSTDEAEAEHRDFNLH